MCTLKELNICCDSKIANEQKEHKNYINFLMNFLKIFRLCQKVTDLSKLSKIFPIEHVIMPVYLQNLINIIQLCTFAKRK